MGVWGHRTPLFCIFEMPMMKSENGILKIASPRVGGALPHTYPATAEEPVQNT